MTDEQKVEVVETKCNCFCHSEWFKKFLVISLGSFVGVFCALSLFAALHKPPMMPCAMKYHMMRPPMGYHQMYRGFRGGSHKNMLPPNFVKNMQPRLEHSEK